MVFEGIEFDMVMMNPPYDGNTHLKILDHVIEQNEDAEIVSLQPVRWLQDPLAEYKKNSDWKKFENIRKHIEDLEIINGAHSQDLFNAAIWGNLGIYHITEAVSNKEYASKYKWFVEKIILKLKDNIANHMTKKRGDCNFSKPFIKISELHGHVGKKDFYDFVSPNIRLAKSKIGGTCMHTVNFDTDIEADNFFFSLQTKFYKYINVCIKYDMNVPWQYAPYMDDYSHPWTDVDLYDYFNLTEEEIREIENAIK